MLELRVQNLEGAGEAAQWHELLKQWPTFLVYVATFATVGIFWVNHHAMFKNVERITYAIALLNVTFLLVVSFIPFVMHVLGSFGITRPAVVLYGVTASVLALLYNLLWHEAWRSVHGPQGRAAARTSWNVVGLLAYPSATLIAIVWPLGALIAFFGLACFYALPANVRAGTIPLPSEPEPRPA